MNQSSKKNLNSLFKSDEIEAWVRSNFDVKNKNKKGWLKICNPFQGRETGTEDTKYHMNIHTGTGAVRDWRPNHKHHDSNIVKFVQDYLRCSKAEAVKAIKSAKKSDISSILEEGIEEQPQNLIDEINLKLPENCWTFEGTNGKLKDICVNYLKSRNIDLQTAIDWGLMYGIGTIIFPYIEYGEVVYWQSRDITSKRFEFPDSSCGLVKTNFLWGWHRADPGTALYIVEAIFNAISIGPGALASGGASLGEKQSQKLDVLSPEKIVLCPDNDAAGIASLIYNYEILKDHKEYLWYCLPPIIDGIKDWNDLDQLKVKNNELYKQYIKEDSIKEYIDNNMKKLDLLTIIKFRKEIKNINTEFQNLIGE